MGNHIPKLALGVAAIVGVLVSNLTNNPKAINIEPAIRNGVQNWSEIGNYRYTPTLKQKVWIFALFYCESSGDNLAINPKDLDGAPSYGLAQWKPETLKYYATRYGLLPDNLETSDYINWAFDPDLSYELLARMIGERDKINWKKEFPLCIKKVGIPPAH